MKSSLNYHLILNISHLLFVPLILYVGYLGVKEEKIPYYLFSFMQAIGTGAIGHQAISLIKKLT
jgi:hypothetical protein